MTGKWHVVRDALICVGEGNAKRGSTHVYLKKVRHEILERNLGCSGLVLYPEMDHVPGGVTEPERLSDTRGYGRTRNVRPCPIELCCSPPPGTLLVLS